MQLTQLVGEIAPLRVESPLLGGCDVRRIEDDRHECVSAVRKQVFKRSAISTETDIGGMFQDLELH